MGGRQQEINEFDGKQLPLQIKYLDLNRELPGFLLSGKHRYAIVLDVAELKGELELVPSIYCLSLTGFFV